MEVLKEVAKEGSAARDGVAIRADQKSYSYKQLVSSAWRISSLLCGTDLNAVSLKFTFCTSHNFLEETVYSSWIFLGKLLSCFSRKKEVCNFILFLSDNTSVNGAHFGQNLILAKFAVFIKYIVLNKSTPTNELVKD